MIRTLAMAVAAALLLAPTVAAAPASNDPGQWTAADNGAYTTPAAPAPT